MIGAGDIISSIKFVADNSGFVTLNPEAITAFAHDINLTESPHWSSLYPLGYTHKVSIEDEMDYLFLIGSQAFCFWGNPAKWTVFYKGKSLDGWWALVACFDRALEQHVPILDGEYLANMTEKDAGMLFAGSPEIPLFKERVRLLNAIGRKLAADHHGRFHNALHYPLDALGMLDVISGFAGFDDVPVYKGKPVYFFKKAQLVVSDIAHCLGSASACAIRNLELLPGHADYKIPAALRSLGILRYSRPLADIVDRRKLIPAGTPAEVEIRANMLWAVREICGRLNHRSIKVTPLTVNGLLWNRSQIPGSLIHPYHLTETVYY
jgi:hypothetical protein